MPPIHCLAWKGRDDMILRFWLCVSSLRSPSASPAGTNSNSLLRAVAGKRMFVLALFGLLLAPQSRVAGRRPGNRTGRSSRRAGEPSHRTGRHRLRGLHRPDGRRPVGQYHRSGHRLPGADALQGRIGGQSRRPPVRDRSPPVPRQFDQAKSQVKLNEAQLDLAKTTLERYQALDKTTPGAVSEQALDQYKAAVVEAEARVDAQKKSLDVYKLNKEFTRVVSPIDGQVSRYYLTLGNLVNQDQTLLTTIVSLDPMYAYFDMDERTLLQIRKAIEEGKITAPADGDIPVLLGLQNEDGFPHRGTINFVNNQVNSTTGSITMRGVFANPPLIPAAKVSDAAAERRLRPRDSGVPAPGAAMTRRFVPRLFSPGMFVRVRLPIGQPHQALLIIDRAIQSDQGLKYVYVLDAQNKVQTRSIKTGALQEDGLRVVEGEIKPDDWVVVGAIQQVRAKWKSSRTSGRCRRWPGKPRPRRRRPGASEARQVAYRRSSRKRTSQRIEAVFMISRFFIDRPIFATVLSVVITLIGGISLVFLPVAQYPRITPPGVNISISYPGASARSWPTRSARPSSNRSTASRACSTCRRIRATTARTR